jgi:nucleotide-binding universal stress UspA family protein
MHVLIGFDIVAEERRVPQAVYGVAPASERAIRYALETFGGDEPFRVTAVHLSTDSISLEENTGAAEIRERAGELGVPVTVEIHSVEGVETMAALRRDVLDLVGSADVDVVVMGYESESFAEAPFTESTPHGVLEEHGTPVVLVP